MVEILPGILEKEWGEIEKRFEAYRGIAAGVHVDLIDGKFAANTTFLDPVPFKKYSQDFLLELHMMVEDPIQYLKPFADAGFARFVGQIEKMPDQVAFVAQGQLLGEVGLGIDADTPVDAIKVPLDDLDSILVMAVKAGFSGQGFLERSLEKVQELSLKTIIPIEVDGGVNDKIIGMGCRAGAERFVATSFLFSAGTPAEQYKILHDATKA
jgi:ribulose-phosphate 3-epimerase